MSMFTFMLRPRLLYLTLISFLPFSFSLTTRSHTLHSRILSLSSFSFSPPSHTHCSLISPRLASSRLVSQYISRVAFPHPFRFSSLAYLPFAPCTFTTQLYVSQKKKKKKKKKKDFESRLGIDIY
ncbi:hypothetical protein BDZ94DRAFT_801480 [Collybia nuda]|uniref:Uncharacterized protein n=1 Tax=Collybia nuda TaxID=64659 RepID=A0A9P5Y3R7_9AGAR|nr:hypothetical protein BDZ94DRAFT_801480 [Collybia nuda]